MKISRGVLDDFALLIRQVPMSGIEIKEFNKKLKAGLTINKYPLYSYELSKKMCTYIKELIDGTVR
jgi:hypothetical protein